MGSEKKKDSYDTEETTQRESTVGSVKGNVTIHAGQTASVSASDIIAGKDTLITGRNVDIESKDNIYRGKEEHEYKKSGLTVSLGGAVITAKDNIIRPIKNAGQARDGLLGKLYAADAGFNLHDAAKTYKNIGDVKKGLTLDVSLAQSAKSDSRYQGTEARESRIVSQGNIRIKSDENIAVKAHR
ncbi:MAG: hemagglutinin repeat-containing protein [Dialister invisus]